MKKLVLLAALLLIGTASGVRADLADGQAAYLRGDYPAAWSSLRGLAEGGDAEAQYIVGAMYDHGQGVARSYAQAAEWYRQAANQGYAEAQFSLGFMLYNGTGTNGGAVAQNYSGAARWFRLAAGQGVVAARHLLGQMYLRGDGVEKDPAAALRWARFAAYQDFAGSQYIVAVLLGNSRVPEDMIESFTWFEVLAQRGYPGAAANRDAVRERLTPAQVALGVQRARSWIERN